MRILLGSSSDEKAEILESALGNVLDLEIIPCKVESGIVSQPLDEQTTRQGALNRAQNALKDTAAGDFSFAIGIEGGLSMSEDKEYSLVCFAVIVDKAGTVYEGKSQHIRLPKAVSDKVNQGEQFGAAIREYENSVSKESDPELFEIVQELISREKSFSSAIKSAYAEYASKIS